MANLACVTRRLMRCHAQSISLILSMLYATSVHATPHFVTFINDADRTVTSIMASPAGTHRWHTLDLGGPLIGGESGQAAVRFDRAEPCKQDLRVSYRGLGPVTINEFDVCRSQSIHLGKALARAMRAIHSRGT